LAEVATLTTLIEPLVRGQGLELVRVAMQGGDSAPRLQIMAEDPATGQMTLEQCATLSRAVSALFDEVDPIEHEYRLEVSSPGIDRPLTRAKDWADWTGHEARLTLDPPVAGQKRLHGIIEGIDGDRVRIGGTELPLASIASAKLTLTDRLIAATRPLSPVGADEISEED
jgi:ribosome maturation factor RimP